MITAVFRSVSHSSLFSLVRQMAAEHVCDLHRLSHALFKRPAVSYARLSVASNVKDWVCMLTSLGLNKARRHSLLL